MSSDNSLPPLPTSQQKTNFEVALNSMNPNDTQREMVEEYVRALEERLATVDPELQSMPHTQRYAQSAKVPKTRL